MTSDVIVKAEHGLGHLMLNRPEALHALNTAMCAAMIDALLAWRDDDSVRAILIDHAPGTRGFCAGGDIRMLAESGAGDGAAARAFFHTEYRLNHLLFTYPKPIVALMDGVTMGGGVGISMPARFRIATERTSFAMPETGIGLFPDVGGGWYLPALAGRDRHVARAHRRAAEGGRLHRGRHRDAFLLRPIASRSSCRIWRPASPPWGRGQGEGGRSECGA